MSSVVSIHHIYFIRMTAKLKAAGYLGFQVGIVFASLQAGGKT